FVYVQNKWKYIGDEWNCCEEKCVNKRPNFFCSNGNGFVKINNDIIIKYINCRNENENIWSNNLTETSQNCLNCANYSLFYFEIKIKKELNSEIDIGLKNFNLNIYFCLESGYIFYIDNTLNINKNIYISTFSLNNEDICGCGLVYPPLNNTINKPYIFFTKNGNKIGKSILLKENYEYLQPYVLLKLCSVEANFGANLNSNPFIYDISKCYVSEEFYGEEELINEEN
ncbi:hypothetical protein Mgra_00000554, partial [Meloidogyne graminicola]